MVTNSQTNVSMLLSLGVYKIMTDTQVFIALVIALVPGILAFRLATELYK
jgi:photosystem I subunit XII